MTFNQLAALVADDGTPYLCTASAEQSDADVERLASEFYCRPLTLRRRYAEGAVIEATDTPAVVR